jgi:hypothetical protein
MLPRLFCPKIAGFLQIGRFVAGLKSNTKAARRAVQGPPPKSLNYFH